MRLLVGFVLLFLVVSLTSCEQKKTGIDGAWVPKSEYENWKNGDSEDIAATESRIGGDIYYVLTNAITINTDDEKDGFHVPGGHWKIRAAEKLSSKRVILSLESYKDPQATGKIVANFLSDDSIYFEVDSMTDKFNLEFGQAFLLTGKDQVLVRCDKKK